MVPRRLGKTGLSLSPIGFGAFKIGRNEKIKYDQADSLPVDQHAAELLNGVLNMGITYIDTAPAYGLSEQRIGEALAHRRSEFVLSTKVGETFAEGYSTYDFTTAAVVASVQRSLRLLKRNVLDIVFVHSDGRDVEIQEQTEIVATLQALRGEGLISTIGFSGKTLQGAQRALRWADAIMVEYHLEDQSHQRVIEQAAGEGVGVIVKKGLASGKLPAADAVRFVLSNPNVTSLVIGGLNLAHMQSNIDAART